MLWSLQADRYRMSLPVPTPLLQSFEDVDVQTGIPPGRTLGVWSTRKDPRNCPRLAVSTLKWYTTTDASGLYQRLLSPLS